MTQAQGLALRVLEFALREHLNNRVKVVPLMLTANDQGFKLLEIPARCDYTGRALYLDAGSMVLKNLESLLTIPLEADAYVQTGWRGHPASTFGALLFNCRGETWKHTPSHPNVASLPAGFAIGRSPKDPRAAFLHFADAARFPWASTNAPYPGVWCRALLQAVQSGFVSRDYLKDEIRHGCVRPSLQHQVDELIEDPKRLPKHVLRRDESFSSPRTSYSHFAAMKVIAPPSPFQQFLASNSRTWKMPRPRYRRTPV